MELNFNLEKDRISSYPNKFKFRSFDIRELAFHGFYFKDKFTIQCHFCNLKCKRLSKKDNNIEAVHKWLSPKCPMHCGNTNNVSLIPDKFEKMQKRNAMIILMSPPSFSVVKVRNFNEMAHPEFRSLERRLKYFDDFSIGNAGFYFSKNLGTFVCYYCNMKLMDAEYDGHETFKNHTSENCNHVKLSELARNTLEMTNNENQQLYCKICYVKPMQVMCLPCSHIVMCAECVLKVDRCVCCQPFKEIQRVFIS